MEGDTQVNTQIADDITAVEENPRYDRSCKVIIAHKPILANIMKECVDEFKDCETSDIEKKYID